MLLHQELAKMPLEITQEVIEVSIVNRLNELEHLLYDHVYLLNHKRESLRVCDDDRQSVNTPSRNDLQLPPVFMDRLHDEVEHGRRSWCVALEEQVSIVANHKGKMGWQNDRLGSAHIVLLLVSELGFCTQFFEVGLNGVREDGHQVLSGGDHIAHTGQHEEASVHDEHLVALEEDLML